MPVSPDVPMEIRMTTVRSITLGEAVQATGAALNHHGAIVIFNPSNPGEPTA